MTTMGIREHAQTAREFLEASDREFAAGDILQGSERLWGAFSHAMTAISQDRGWDLRDPQENYNCGPATGR